MRPLLFITVYFSASCFGQTYKKFTDFSTKQLNSNQTGLSKYYQHFLTLITKRDTSYLKEKLTKTKADKIYIIEGYNFENGKYSIFEEYKLKSNPNDPLGNSEFYLDKKLQPFYSSYFLYKVVSLRKDSISIDTIFPRKYRYGAGCVITDTTFKIFNDLKQKAAQDGIAIEKYCRIETLIDRTNNKIFIKYYFPVSGQREFESLGAGFATDYPPGLDFWLFASPYYVDE